jgi:hypothetical protein
MNAAYVKTYHIYTEDEMVRFEKDGELKPSWEQGKENHFLVAMQDTHVVGVADLTVLLDGWRLVEPMHVLPRLWGCGMARNSGRNVLRRLAARVQ